MKTNMLAIASALPDRDLLARTAALARTEREATADLVAHLAALEVRPSALASEGYGSLFAYCTEALRLSEDAACSRIDVARLSLRFPVILELLASASLNLTAVRLLRPHLTEENHHVVLARAANKPRRDVEALVAELAPRPDVPTSVRKLPAMKPAPGMPSVPGLAQELESAALWAPVMSSRESEDLLTADDGATSGTAAQVAPHPSSRPIVQTLAPNRYKVQFTIGQETHGQLQRLQRLLRREVPSGDLGVIFAQAVELYLQDVERAKLGATAKARRCAPAGKPTANYEKRIRFRTDNPEASELGRPPSRHIPNQVKREVWRRDGAQCAYVSSRGHRCTERAFLELHHVDPYAKGGPATVENIALRCRRHNQYEAEQIFGPHGTTTVSEPRTIYGYSKESRGA